MLLFSWRRLAESRRIRNLLISVVGATIAYGVVTGSYFGVAPPVGSVLDAVRIRIGGQPMMENQNTMMGISVAIGVAHLMLANLLVAWNKRASLRSLGHVGWALAMLGAGLLGAAMMLDLNGLMLTGQTLAITGAVAILLFSSDRSFVVERSAIHGSKIPMDRGAIHDNLDNPRSGSHFLSIAKWLLLRLVDGLMQFTSISKAFGDALSYLRLFALGLASAQLAITFNGLASSSFKAGGFGVLLALLILVVGHGINFLLGLMSGVVHGLRLNCIEFFNWGLEDEGYAFQPFRKKAS